MAITQNTFTGDGSTVLFSFTFPYLDESHIKVSLNGSDTILYTLANATTIQMNTAPANGVAIRIYRNTDSSSLEAQFFSGSSIRAQDLNDNFTQVIFKTQETENFAASTDSSVIAGTAASAVSTANTALSVANTANTTANGIAATANTALSNSTAAVTTANAASALVTTAVPSGVGAIVNADINASAAIVDTKLATISTAGKVSDSALPDTISSNITGNAATVTNGVYTNANATITAQHSHQTSNTAIANSAGGLARLEVIGTGGAAFLQFHRPNSFAAYFGLDSDNQFKIGGYSYGNASYPILHSANYNSYAPTLGGSGAYGTWNINITGTAAAATTVAGAVGAYQLCKNQSGGTINAGATVAGSSLKQGYGDDGGGWFGSEPSPSGTWRHMGSRNMAFTQHGLFQRIA